jgi:dihydroflavonol-4-reductase
MKTGYVTGATGCVGRNLVDELVRDGWDVVVLHRKSSDLSRLEGCSVRYQPVDLHDPHSTMDSIGEDVDAIFHVAANTSHWSAEREQQWKDNVLATRNLVRAALEKRVKRFIFTSTGATLPHQGADEQLTSKIKNSYIRTKRLAELEVYKGIEEGLYAVILQPIIVIGPYDYNNYAQIFSEIKAGRMKVAFPGRIAFCHAGDVARAHVEAFEKGVCHENYVLGGTYTTWLDAFQRIARRIGANPPSGAASRRTLMAVSYAMAGTSYLTGKKPVLSPELVSLIGDAPDVSFSEKRKAKEHLGYESRSLDVMIEDCYQWLLREGRI